MNRVVLCEGATDAILLSYYLGKVAGWKHCKPLKDVFVSPDSFEQSIEWYEKGSERLLICGVGGKDKMRSFFIKKILRPTVQADAFSKLAIVLDKDDKDITSIEDHASSIISDVGAKVRNNCWIENEYMDAFSQRKTLETLLIIIPPEHEGALETLMLDAISEDPYDEAIVKKTGEFIEDISEVASKYISKRREKLKAHLGVTWAIQYPEKVFKLMDEQIRSVSWEKSEVLQRCFEKLVMI